MRRWKTSTHNTKEKKTAGQLYSAGITGSSAGLPGPTACTPIPVPEGTHLVPETIVVEGQDLSFSGPPDVFIRFRFQTEDSFDLTELRIPLEENFPFAGILHTRIVSGPVTVGDGEIIFDLCVRDGSFTGYIVGQLLPL